MIVTIDGPAGAGKSSAAKSLARRLGFRFLDTGAMYRAVALAATRTHCDLHSDAELTRLISTLHLEMPGEQVLLNGEDVSFLLRTPEITAATGPVADNKAVRRQLVAWQRAIAAGRNMVSEGRDQGTIVFPDAECKFFLTAEPEARAMRRHRELSLRDPAITLEAVLRAQEIRDARDAARDIAPMVPADDAIVLDTTPFTIDEVVVRMEAIAVSRRG